MIHGPVRIHPAALEEADAAIRWYAERSRRAAEAFLHELSRAIDRIAEDPDRFPEFAFGSRRLILRRFPYVVVFRIGAAGVEILAVAHGRRRPGYWQERA